MSSHMGAGVHHHCTLLLLAVLGLGLLLAAPATARTVPAAAAGHYRMMTDVSIQREVPTGSNPLHNHHTAPSHGAMQTEDVSIQHQVPKGNDPIHNETPSPYDVVKTTDVSIQHKVPVGKGDPIHNQTPPQHDGKKTVYPEKVN
ncbi:hypothetical protein ACP70R_035232 [Stipagrostis hirtigluma subsp. patula]